jgi:hypothetical protein
MSKSDPHENLRHLEKMFGTSDSTIRDAVALQQFTLKNWYERQDIISRTDQAISADDSASLRQRAGLMQFSTKLKTANALLRKIGR